MIGPSPLVGCGSNANTPEEHDDTDRVLEERTTGADGLTRTTTRTYNALGQLVEHCVTGGGCTTFAYEDSSGGGSCCGAASARRGMPWTPGGTSCKTPTMSTRHLRPPDHSFSLFA